MYSISSLLCKSKDNNPIEGYLGEEESCNILFMLKEPNDPNPQNGFWLKDVVNELTCGGTKFINVMGKIANILLCGSNNTQGYRHALQKCAFINMYPFCGNATKSSCYDETVKLLNSANLQQARPLDAETDVINYQDIANNRLALVFALKPRYIVTVDDIYNGLQKHKNGKELKGLYYNVFYMRAYKLENGTTVVRFYHPSYRRIKYEFLDKAVFCWEEL